MKFQLFSSLLLIVFLLSFSNTAKAQKIDASIFVESLEDLEAQDKVLPILNVSSFKFQEKSAMQNVTPKIEKQFSLPKGTKISTKPLVLLTYTDKKETHCIQFSCAEPCKNCHLVWFDKNGDGQIQPIAELRCMNKEGRQGGLKAVRVKCK